MDVDCTKRKLDFLKKPISIICVSVFLVVLLILVFYFVFVPKLTLNGDEYVKVIYGNKYEEQGCSATYFGKDLSSKVWYEGNVDESVVGDCVPVVHSATALFPSVLQPLNE